MGEQHQILTDIHEHILEGNPDGAAAHTKAGLDIGCQPLDLVYDAMIPALKEVGRRFEAGEYFLPEMLISAQAMEAAMGIVRPLLAEGTMKPLGIFVMGTVAGDIHDIGKNLCNTMLESSGFKVIDLGVNVSAETFVEAIKTHRPDAVGMSAFLTTTMQEVDRNISAITEAGLRDQVTIMVGGAPLSQEYAARVGADGFAPDANSTVRVTKQLLGIEEPEA